MRIFVTGATGFVGSAIVTDLIKAGHQVLGLTRSNAGAESLVAAGAEAHRGDLADRESLRRGVEASDGVVHAAFDHDFSNFAQNCAADQQAIEVMGGVLEGSDRPLIVTSGLPLTPGRVTTENDVTPADGGGSPRVSEPTAFALIARGVNVSVVRMSQVHDRNKQGLAAYMIALAREKGVSAYVGDGLNRWSSIHRLDAAPLYRLALEKNSAGARYHAVAEEGVSLRDIAETIGRRLNLPINELSPAEAQSHFGWLGFLVSMDAPASSTLTQQQLGWRPTQKSGFIADLERSTEFDV
ncbi:MAG: SDR family oxidoreductase [Dokdonella sp.]